MTSILNWLPQMWRANWTAANRFHRLLIQLFGAYLLAIIACVYLSAFGLREVIGLIGALYVFVVIVIPLHPLVWEALIAGGYVRGQVGGEVGFSASDGLERIKLWAKLLLGKWGKFLLFYGTVPFVWTAINDTEGAILTHLVLLPLIPPAVYYAVERWPDSQSIFRWIGRVYLALVFLAVGVDIYTSIQHWLADPGTKVVLAHERAVQQEQLALEKKVAKTIRRKLERGETLTASEEKAWKKLGQKAESQKVKSAVGNLVDKTRDLMRAAPGGIAGWWREASPVDVKASANLDQAREGHFRREAAKCANALAELWKAGTPPTADQEADCRKKQDAAGSATASGGGATSSTATPAASNLKTFWSGSFAPGKDSTSLGNFASGSYRVVGSGEYTLRILYAGGTHTDVKLDKDGRWVGAGHGTQVPYSGPGSHPAPLPNKPVGAVYALANGKPIEASIGGQCFYPVGDGDELRLDVNVPTHAANRVTAGKLELRVEKC